MNRALITGITGQDGSYLARLLLRKGYEVHGIKRRSSSFNTDRIDDIYQDTHVIDPKLHLHYGDLTDGSSLFKILREVQPTEIYNLGAQSHVKVSFSIPEYTADVDAMGTLRLLEAIRSAGLVDTARFYQASSSEMFGLVQEVPQREATPFYPRSPYGVSKLFAHWMTVNYREAYGLFACSGILFNHESPVRGESFVTRKITRGFARIEAGVESCIYIGNLNARRDWGFAGDYVEAQWLMLQADTPQDYVIATGEQHSVRDFIEAAATHMNITIVWRGSGLQEVGIVDGVVRVRIDPEYYRPTEVDTLLGDPSKAMKNLGWRPKMDFAGLVACMIESDRSLIRNSL